MLAPQRQQEILRRLNLEGVARVADLAGQLEVAEETVRRDLEKLEKEGKLMRTHGGALPVPDSARDLPWELRRSANHEAKVSIAHLAVQHVEEGDVVAMDASATVHEMTRVLPDMLVTVITNSLLSTVRLLNRRRVRVLSTGGVLDDDSASWVGSFAEQALERININKFFLSSKGVDLERGLSEISDAQARVKRRMFDMARRKYLLVDSSKFNLRSVVQLAGLDEVDVVITDAGITPEVRAALENLGKELEVSAAVARRRRDDGVTA